MFIELLSCTERPYAIITDSRDGEVFSVSAVFFGIEVGEVLDRLSGNWDTYVQFYHDVFDEFINEIYPKIVNFRQRTEQIKKKSNFDEFLEEYNSLKTNLGFFYSTLL